MCVQECDVSTLRCRVQIPFQCTSFYVQTDIFVAFVLKVRAMASKTQDVFRRPAGWVVALSGIRTG